MKPSDRWHYHPATINYTPLWGTFGPEVRMDVFFYNYGPVVVNFLILDKLREKLTEVNETLSTNGFERNGGFEEEKCWLHPGKLTHTETWIRWIDRESNLYQQVHVKWLEDLEEK